ncbi:MAG: hypothetical protein LBI10_06700 [Deltaproteobacteria bacterium]|jgi:hypothetical protein|nr:hypothetical protein [Deltaproteobacteria bacterium]
MTKVSFWDFRLFYRALKSRAANRVSLDILDDFFSKAAAPVAILGHFNVSMVDLTFLEALALKKDGWWPLSELKGVDKATLTRLVQNGFLLARPFKGLVRLSDAGRFLLILCVRAAL